MRRGIALGATTAIIALALSACAASGNADKVNWDATIASNSSDPFVASYESDDPTCLITTHKNLGNTCSTCHDDEVAQLVGTFEEMPNHSDLSEGTREFCLECHDEDAVIKQTSDIKGTVTVYNQTGIYNPHDNHRGDQNCSECHSMHGTSTLYCVECHEIEVPDGWNGYM